MAEGDMSSVGAADSARVLAELQQIIGFHISLANTAIKAHFQTHFSDLKLTQKQIAILWLVEGCPGIIQVDLARMLHVKRATMSAMIRVLSTRGLLTRDGPGEIDARHVPLELTAEGRKALRGARRAIETHEAWVKGHFNAEERKAIAVLMKRLYEREAR